jgi:Ca2+-binding RTX toxin-like protein
VLGKSRRRWRLWTCLAACIALPAAFAGGAQAATNTFTNPNPIAIPATGTSGVANPYPSIIRLSGFTGQVSDIDVGFQNLSHTFPDDIDVLLVGPAGQSVILMSDTGGSSDINVDLTFDDSAANSLPDASQILSGTYKPTNIGAGDTFPSPAPAGPYGTTLAGFNNTNPNGDWRLYVFDDAGGDTGSMAGGWSLKVTTPTNENPTGTPGTGPGKRTLKAGACANGQKGTKGDDVLNGTRAGDRIRGLGGDDILRGRAGRDCLSGGSGDDRVSGGSGGDRISGGSGNNRLSGGSGNDRINSKNGRKDRVNCGSGRRDRVHADSIDIVRNCEIVR